MSVESQITAQKRKLEEKIADLRGSTMRHTHMGRDGKLKVTNEEAVDLINAQVTDAEAKIVAIDAVIEEMQQLYPKAGVESLQQLNTLGKQQADTIRSAAPRSWQAFMLARGQGASIPGRDRTTWLVSDIVALPEY